MKFAILALLALLFLSACTTEQNNNDAINDHMTGMPCHQMPDGSWMGDCGEAQELETVGENPCGDNVGHMHEEDEPCALDHDHPTVDLPAGAQKVTNLNQLTAQRVIANIGGKDTQFYAYNGVIPGPTLMVTQGDSQQVTFTNDIDMNTTVHWHGLRHDNKDDGVPWVTQKPVAPGQSHNYTISFPDYGSYWYHPHIREDKQQDLGLAGLIIVKPKEDIYNQVDREEVLVLDDILVSNNGLTRFGDEANRVLMGRYGNVMLVNGEVDLHMQAQTGETIRFYLANVANVRPFNVSIKSAKMKLVGSDMSLYQQEQFVDSVIIAPAQRYIVEVLFDKAGSYQLTHKTPHGEAHLGEIIVEGEDSNQVLSINPTDRTDIAEFEPYFDKEIDHTITLDIDMPMMHMMDNMMGDSTGSTGMPCHQMGDGSWMGDCDEEEIDSIEGHMAGGIEWEDEMGMMNAMSNPDALTWILRDNQTGLENMDIAYDWKVGDKVKIRIINDENSAHPMQHPIHIHGQRFIITHIDGEPVENKVWKDTVLIPTGQTFDILVDVTNPGEWMFHCHIAEHLEAGMMGSFSVSE